ncbi:unnamed protein product [Dimorphilus gyrociliatus]|uniref:Uncharacterized protein n=1 Tax=Dimorphilus gyrociliatus TaxID=2664684 RepID=A0A7I8VJE9_9ANNE|nr:unnamed protein product [Dimorphilus gyrociliatus]
MATAMKHVNFLRSAASKFSLLNASLNTNFVSNSSKRYLFSGEILGLENYLRHRDQTLHRLGDLQTKFGDRMREYLKSENEQTIFTDDLKTIVYAAKGVDDLELTKIMINKYHKQSEELRFSTFHFGPIVMRLAHVLNNPQFAWELFNDKNLNGFFDQMSSFVILMDLLFNSKLYEDCLKALQIIADKNLNGVKYPMDCVTIAAAACLKLNTPQAFKVLLSILRESKKLGSSVSIRSLVYAAELALLQGSPETALEILSMQIVNEGRRTPLAYVNTKLKVNIELGRFEDCLASIKSCILMEDLPESYRKNGKVFESIINSLKSGLEEKNDVNLNMQFTLINSMLEQGDHISSSSYEDYLMRPVIRRRKLHDGYKSRERSSFPGERNNRKGNRPGLLEA